MLRKNTGFVALKLKLSNNAADTKWGSAFSLPRYSVKFTQLHKRRWIIEAFKHSLSLPPMVTTYGNRYFVPPGISMECVGETLALLKSLGCAITVTRGRMLLLLCTITTFSWPQCFYLVSPSVGEHSNFYLFASCCSIPYYYAVLEIMN